MTIRSVYFDQTEILKGILSLIGATSFDADISYGNGGFYKGIPKPRFRIDVDPGLPDLTHFCSSEKLPPELVGVRSIVFDPPFLTYIKKAREHAKGLMVMSARFGGYWNYAELEDHYRRTLDQCYSVLASKGIVVFKCQDIIHNHKMHATHINIVNWCEGKFRLKDLYILPAKTRMPIKNKVGEKPRKQQHARVFHSYFLVLEKLK